MANRKTLRDAVKADYMAKLMEYMREAGEDVGRTASNEFNFPVTDAEGNEDFIVIKVVIPTGTRAAAGGEDYDGYGARNDYEINLKNKEAKAKAAAEAKARKIARDAKNRAKA